MCLTHRDLAFCVSFKRGLTHLTVCLCAHPSVCPSYFNLSGCFIRWHIIMFLITCLCVSIQQYCKLQRQTFVEVNIWFRWCMKSHMDRNHSSRDSARPIGIKVLRTTCNITFYHRLPRDVSLKQIPCRDKWTGRWALTRRPLQSYRQRSQRWVLSKRN